MSCKMRTTIPCGKIKPIIIAKTILVANRGKAGAHHRESGIGFLNAYRIVLEMCAVPTNRTGTVQLNGFKNFHVLMSHNV